MKTDLPANVRPVRDRHGKTRYRFRRKGWPSAYLQGEPGSPEFHRSYAEIVERGPAAPIAPASPKAARIAPRSLDDAFRRHKASPRWHRKAESTQRVQARVLERFLDRIDRKGRRFGDRPVSRVTVAWLDRLLGEMHETPGAANNLRKFLTAVMDEAVRAGWRTDNPVRMTEKYASGKGFHDWTDAEIEQYRAAHPLGTMARLTLELALNTAARRCNVNKIERDHVREGRVFVTHAKGGAATSVRMMASTKAAIDALPAQPIRFLVTTQYGKPFSDAGLGNRMRKWCDEAGLPHCSMHGLRKAMSRQLAEAGATDAEGMAVTGHRKAATFAYYREAANQPHLADRAMSNLEARAIVQPSKNRDNSGD
ncbi:MAG: tyrosine-type recombinase/integrase [Erythrobacter sp.]